MKQLVRSALILACSSISRGAAAEEAAPSEVTALLTDGRRVRAEEVREWHKTDADPKLGDARLFDPSNPARWILRTEAAPPASPKAFVELRGGDVFPGRVLSFQASAAGPWRRWPAHLLVEPEVPVSWPDAPPTSGVRIVVDRVRRIVWEAVDRPWSPGKAYFRDGREVSFRSLRWSETSARLLLDDRTFDVPFGALAELHIPWRDPWDSYAELLAGLGAQESSRLAILEVEGGLRLTTAVARFQARSRGGEGDARNWYHCVQPVWSLESFWLQHRRILRRVYFPASEPPLSIIEPRSARKGPGLGSSWTWRTDRSAQGGPLVAGALLHGWGFGVHAPMDLAFPLAEMVEALRARVGLDDAAGDGGCARARILLAAGAGSAEAGRETMWESPYLVGSREIRDTGWLEVPRRPTSEIVLSADMAHEGRPDGADPLDIRDVLDWIEPEVRLDPGKLRLEIARRARRWFPAWDGWSIAGLEAAPISTASLWHDGDASWDLGARPVFPFLELSRRLDLPGEEPKLLVTVSRPEGEATSRLRVTANGSAVGELEVPVRRSRGWPDPLVFPIESLRGREVELEIVQLSQDAGAFVSWAEISISDTPPGLVRVFDDQAELPEGADSPALWRADKHLGEASLRVPPGEASWTIASSLEVPVTEHPRPGEYRWICFAWKKVGGGGVALELGHEGWSRSAGRREGLDRRRTFRYVAGEPPGARTGKVVEEKPPEEWRLVIRDLWSDFGSFTLTGVACAAGGGDVGLFDAVYLGRSREDLEKMLKEKRRQP